MRFLNSDDLTYTQMEVIDYKPDILVNYKLVETSGTNLVSIDRGSKTDRNASTMTFRGLVDTIETLVKELTLLRSAGKQVKIDEFEENMFGDNVDHSGIINCIIDEFGEENSPNFNVQTIEITFLPTDLIYNGTGVLPQLRCLDHKWRGFADWNTHVQETYNRNNYFIDRESDTYTFEGTYSLLVEDNKNLLSFWRLQRGVKFTINETNWGVEHMFGGNITDTTHDVVIIDIDYSNSAVDRRDTKIKLVKVG